MHGRSLILPNLGKLKKKKEKKEILNSRVLTLCPDNFRNEIKRAPSFLPKPETELQFLQGAG